MADVVRIGIVGTGGIARGQHIPGYLRRKDAKITMFCDVNEQALCAMGATYGVDNLTTDYMALVNSPEVDAISVCTSNDMHHPVTMAAIGAGKHVLCEKPLAMNYAQASEMYLAAKQAGLVGGVGFVHRCTPSARLAHRLVSSGALGKVYHVIANYSYGMVPGPVPTLVWRRQKERAGAGVSWDLGAHMIDMTRWWLGQEITAVSARLKTYVTEAALPTGEGMAPVTTDDASSFIADFDGGALGTFLNTTHLTGRGFEQKIEVYGSQGALRYDQDKPYTLQVAIGKEMMDLFLPRGVERPEPYPSVPVPAELRDRWPGMSLTPDFVGAIRGDSAFMPTFYDGMRVQQVLDALLQSNAERCWVQLPSAEKK